MDYQQLFSAPIDVGSRLLAAMQQQQMTNNLKLVNTYNEDPASLNKQGQEMAKAIAMQYGLDTSRGDAKLNNTFGKQALAFGGGLLDALLFGILRDSWYSNEYTKNAKNAGKAAGLLASFLLPIGILNATKGAKAALGGAQALTGGAKAAAGGAKAAAKSGKTLQELIGEAKAAAEAAKAAAEAAEGAKAGAKAMGAAKSIGANVKSALAANEAIRELYTQMSASQALLEIAKALVRGSQAMGIAHDFMTPTIPPQMGMGMGMQNPMMVGMPPLPNMQ